MSDWRLHTPVGINDVLPEQCRIKKEIQDWITRLVFAPAGYKEVEVPTVEYYDCYAGEDSSFSQEDLFKFFDSEGRILALRPDFTTSIARMTATKMSGRPRPLRFSYTGNVFRPEHCEGARQREFTQCGIELIGSCSPEADAEVIYLAAQALDNVGIEDFTMEIGQVAFFGGLVEQAGLDAQMTEKLRERIDLKDSVGIKSIVDKLDIDEKIKNLMIELPYLFGGREVIDKARVDGLNHVSEAALDNLEEVYSCLCDFGCEEKISIDLGMLQSIDYYTGTIFKGYTRGVGFPVCAGGRYDNLVGKFGEPEGAVGVAMGINRILTALGQLEVDEEESNLIYFERAARSDAYLIVDHLKKFGEAVVPFIGGGDYSNAVEYARDMGFDRIIRVYDTGRLTITDIKTGKITESTVKELSEQYIID